MPVCLAQLINVATGWYAPIMMTACGSPWRRSSSAVFTAAVLRGYRPIATGSMPRRSRARRNALVTVTAERIVLVHDRDALDTQIRGQAGDHFLGFLPVGSAHVDDIAPRRIAQKSCAGKRSHIGHAGRRGDRHGRARSRRTDRTDQGKDLFFLDQLVGVDHRGFRLVGVVEGDQFERAAVDAAALVDLPKGGLDAALHVSAELLGGTAEGGGLAEEYPLVGNSGRWLGLRSATGRCGIRFGRGVGGTGGGGRTGCGVGGSGGTGRGGGTGCGAVVGLRGAGKHAQQDRGEHRPASLADIGGEGVEAPIPDHWE